MPDFERGAWHQVVYAAQRLYRNVEPCGNLALCVAFFHDIGAFFLELVLHVVVCADNGFLGYLVDAFLQVPVREVDYRFGVDVNFSVMYLEMQVRSR